MAETWVHSSCSNLGPHTVSAGHLPLSTMCPWLGTSPAIAASLNEHKVDPFISI